MKQRTIMAGAVVVFLIGTFMGDFVIDMMRKPPKPSKATQELIGSQAPIFTLKALDGVKESSDQWVGKVQVVNFWASWCPPCKREIPSLMEIQDQYGVEGLQIIGIAVDNDQSAKDYALQNHINYPILIGEDEAVETATQLGNDLGILPYTVIIDRIGNISHVKYGELRKKELEDKILPLL